MWPLYLQLATSMYSSIHAGVSLHFQSNSPLDRTVAQRCSPGNSLNGTAEGLRLLQFRFYLLKNIFQLIKQPVSLGKVPIGQVLLDVLVEPHKLFPVSEQHPP